MSIRTIYVPHVYDRWERSSGLSARVAQTSIGGAQDVLDLERAWLDKPKLEWRLEFGGATAEDGDLVYEVTPVEVNLP